MNNSTMLFIFLHRYRWGYQIRGDERGFYEKAKIYKKWGNRLLVIEKRPSLQEAHHISIYTSLQVCNFSQPLRNVFELAKVTLCTFIKFLRFNKRPLFVYAYNQDPENVIVAYLAKFLLRVPMIILYHHISQNSLSNLRDGFRRRRASGYSVGASLWNSIIPWLNYLCAKRADIHLALSRSTATEVKRSLGIHQCIAIGNGVDTKTFREMYLDKVYDAAFLGRLVPQKGIDVLLKAWSQVIKSFPTAKLLLIGGADAEMLRSYIQMAQNLGIKNSVRFTGFVDDEELVRLLNQCKLFVFPSRREGFAQAVSQAMACGLCCILSDLPSLREVYGDSAIYFPNENHEELSKLIVKCLDDESIRQSKGIKARQHVSSMKWEGVVEQELAAISLLFKKAS